MQLQKTLAEQLVLSVSFLSQIQAAESEEAEAGGHKT
jgi:hypothetical protein